MLRIILIPIGCTVPSSTKIQPMNIWFTVEDGIKPWWSGIRGCRSRCRMCLGRIFVGMVLPLVGWTCWRRLGGKMISFSSGMRGIMLVSWMKLWIGMELNFQAFPVSSTHANSARNIRIWSSQAVVMPIRLNYSTKVTIIGLFVRYIIFLGRWILWISLMMIRCLLFLGLMVMYEYSRLVKYDIRRLYTRLIKIASKITSQLWHFSIFCCAWGLVWFGNDFSPFWGSSSIRYPNRSFELASGVETMKLFWSLALLFLSIYSLYALEGCRIAFHDRFSNLTND